MPRDHLDVPGGMSIAGSSLKNSMISGVKQMRNDMQEIYEGFDELGNLSDKSLEVEEVEEEEQGDGNFGNFINDEPLFLRRFI